MCSPFVRKRANKFKVHSLSSGPNVPGIDPREASERLAIYQTRFDELWRKFTTYSGGEELFGLPVTDYPDLQVRQQPLLVIKDELT